MDEQLEFAAKLWIYTSAPSAWYFITVPQDLAAQIRFFTRERKAAWGSVRVSATIGKSTWQTSLFRNGKEETYLLPIKADIRKKERLQVGDVIAVRLAI